MRQTLTISLPPKIKKQLESTCREEGLSRSDVIRESLSHYLFLKKFRRLRERLLDKLPKTYTDEDIFKIVS